MSCIWFFPIIHRLTRYLLRCIFCGFLLALGRQMYKSKCREIDICCIHIKRDVETEEKIDEIQMQRPQSASSTHNDLEFTSSPNNI